MGLISNSVVGDVVSSDKSVADPSALTFWNVTEHPVKNIIPVRVIISSVTMQKNIIR